MAAQILASLEDINGQLPDHARFVQDNEDAQLQIDAVRLIRGQLTTVFTPAIIVGWDSPENTPQLIRGIAARLIAARYYAEKMAGETDSQPDYPQVLYNEAISMLTQIRTGELIVTDDSGEPIGTNLLAENSADFWPNDSTPDGPFFKMGDVWA